MMLVKHILLVLQRKQKLKKKNIIAVEKHHTHKTEREREKKWLFLSSSSKSVSESFFPIFFANPSCSLWEDFPWIKENECLFLTMLRKKGGRGREKD